jgi:DNA-3-methyladenine glycosylase II
VKPAYWDEACAALSAADPVMGRIIAACAPGHLVSRGDPFQTLARSIVGQQISVKAAQSVWNRFAAAAGTVEPQRVSRMRITTLRAAGLSERKAEYLKDLARHFTSGEVEPERWPTLDDEAVIDELIQVRGIGRWTAEMFLIFNLLRPDVLPLDDIGVLRGIGLAYGRGERVAAREALAIGEAWRPWRTVATWYLWRSLDPLPVEY